MEGQSMVTRKVLTGLAAAGLVFGSTAAAAAPAVSARDASPVAASEGLTGGFAWILALIIAAGFIGVIASDNGSDTPTSP